MPVDRSALQSRAARSASAADAPGMYPTISGKSARMRSTLSYTDPSFAWNTRDFSFSVLDASVSFRSVSQKNFASESRARRTRSFPATISAPPSAAFIFATTIKRGARLPSLSRREKYFWCDRMEVIRTSFGTLMNSASIFPIRGTGYSASPVTSFSSPSSSCRTYPASSARA